jgi:threonine/homoserine/homoserine lactone efflux protein
MYEGAFLGLTLSFMIGPLFFAIVQASIERGFYAGLAVGAGIWLSDLLYVVLLKSSMQTFHTLTQLPYYTLCAGLGGSVLLTAFGAVTLWKHRRPQALQQRFTAQNLSGYALRGFAINTVNPFTVFFWLGTAATMATYTQERMWAFFTGMFGVLIVTDVFKARMAHWLRDHLSPHVVSLVQRCIGVLLIVAGATLAIRSF